MGKQSKSNAKKEQRKLTQRRRAALEERLRAPRSLQDCGAGFLQPALLRVGALEISFERTPSTPDLAACFDILEENMKEQREREREEWRIMHQATARANVSRCGLPHHYTATSLRTLSWLQVSILKDMSSLITSQSHASLERFLMPTLTATSLRNHYNFL